MRYADLDLDALRAFVTVSDLEGFTAAGDRLGRTQAAISLKIKRLEEVLGRRLFDRTSRSLALTRDGELLLTYARRLLELNDETVRRFAEPEAEGELRIGVAEYFVPRHLPGVLRAFARAYPRVRLDVHVATTAGLVADGGLDLVIGMRDAGDGRGRLLAVEPLRWVVAHGVTVPPDGPVPLCSLPGSCVYRGRAQAALDGIGRPWRTVYTSASVMGVQAAVEAGLGIAALNEPAVPPGLRLLGPADGFPDLGTVEMAVIADNPRKTRLTEPLIGFILDALDALEGRRSAA